MLHDNVFLDAAPYRLILAYRWIPDGAIDEHMNDVSSGNPMFFFWGFALIGTAQWREMNFLLNACVLCE